MKSHRMLVPAVVTVVAMAENGTRILRRLRSRRSTLPSKKCITHQANSTRREDGDRSGTQKEDQRALRSGG